MFSREADVLPGKHLHHTPAPSPLLQECPDNGSRAQPPAPVLPARHAHGRAAGIPQRCPLGNEAREQRPKKHLKHQDKSCLLCL